MRIHLERTGGFAGLTVEVSVDTTSLPDDEARPLCDAIHAARFFDLPANLPPQMAGADRFHYTLTVATAEQRHTVEMGETAVPDELRPLLRRLTVLARRK